MNVLLDTCALLALSRGELPATSAHVLQTAAEASVSVVTAWEVAIKVASGKLSLAVPPDHWFDQLVERHGLRALPLDARTACAAAALPRLHHDPFDRVIVALAQQNALAVATSDAQIGRYPGVATLW